MAPEAMTDPLRQLSEQGVAIWLDDLSRERLATGNLQWLVDERQVVGVTSNPTIFQAAITKSTLYDDQLRTHAQAGSDAETAVRDLTTDDVRAACDLLAPVVERTGGLDGRVSLEVDPRLALDTDATLAQARDLWAEVDRPNLFIKIPATRAGLPAITAAIAEGISINVTLIFSIERYREVMDAYQAGLEQRLAAGASLAGLESVASFFVSRVDSEVDKRLDTIGGEPALGLRGKAAVANAQLAYQAYEQVVGADRWRRLESAGASRQRPLWASTSTKNPDYPDTLYVTELVAPQTVNTMPEQTLEAVADHGEIRGDTVRGSYQAAQGVFDALARVGVDVDDVGRVLEEEGVEKFATSWIDLLGSVHLYQTSRPLLAEIEAVVADLRADGLDRVVLWGMGGSSLAPEVIPRTAGVELTVLDTTDPDPIRRALADRLDRTVVVVSSKSGSTVETDSQRRAFEAAFREAGIDPGPRMVAVTDDGSALAEADVSALLDDAAAAAPAILADDPANPALVLGAALGGGHAAGRDKIAIADAGSGIVGFADWAEQLIAESTGKQGKGLLPLALAGRDEPEIRWTAADVLPVLVGAAQVPGDGVSVSGPLGAQFLLWEYATAVAGRLIGIDPFDQPDVESAKKAARGLLDARPEPEPPAFVDGVVEVRGTPGLLDGVDSLASAVDALAGVLADRGYLAVMAYLDREGEDAALAGVRRPLALRTERPVTFGWGPRFLHSTGQYHKGGPATSVYLQVTGAPTDDVPVPERPFTFGQLIAAQAAGDAQVLADHGRPVLRLHLGDRKAGVSRLLEVLR